MPVLWRAVRAVDVNTRGTRAQVAEADEDFQWSPIDQVLRANGEKFLLRAEFFEREKGSDRPRRPRSPADAMRACRACTRAQRRRGCLCCPTVRTTRWSMRAACPVSARTFCCSIGVRAAGNGANTAPPRVFSVQEDPDDEHAFFVFSYKYIKKLKMAVRTRWVRPRTRPTGVALPQSLAGIFGAKGAVDWSILQVRARAPSVTRMVHAHLPPATPLRVSHHGRAAPMGGTHGPLHARAVAAALRGSVATRQAGLG
jgi:hypothetical protein